MEEIANAYAHSAMGLLIVPSYSQNFYSGGCRYDKEEEFVRLRITRESV